MSNYLMSETYGRANKYNFLSSEHYHTITWQFKTTDGTTVGDKTIVKAGTVFSTEVEVIDENSSTVTQTVVVGIVFEDVDVTNGDELGAILVGGRVWDNRVTTTSTQKSALEAMGIFFDTYPTVER